MKFDHFKPLVLSKRAGHMRFNASPKVSKLKNYHRKSNFYAKILQFLEISAKIGVDLRLKISKKFYRHDYWVMKKNFFSKKFFFWKFFTNLFRPRNFFYSTNFEILTAILKIFTSSFILKNQNRNLTTLSHLIWPKRAGHMRFYASPKFRKLKNYHRKSYFGVE